MFIYKLCQIECKVFVIPHVVEIAVNKFIYSGIRIIIININKMIKISINNNDVRGDAGDTQLTEVHSSETYVPYWATPSFHRHACTILKAMASST